MSFLKKFGKVAAAVSQVVVGIGPLIPASSEKQTKVQNSIIDIAGVILTVESFGATLGTPGVDKLKAAGPLVSQIILQSDLMTGKKIDNPTVFNEGCIAIADGMAKVLNSLKPESVELKSLPI